MIYSAIFPPCKMKTTKKQMMFLTLCGLGLGNDFETDETPNWASISEAEWQKIKTSGITKCVHSYLWGSC